jgi:hypothetical protein
MYFRARYGTRNDPHYSVRTSYLVICIVMHAGQKEIQEAVYLIKSNSKLNVD